MTPHTDDHLITVQVETGLILNPIFKAASVIALHSGDKKNISILITLLHHVCQPDHVPLAKTTADLNSVLKFNATSSTLHYLS